MTPLTVPMASSPLLPPSLHTRQSRSVATSLERRGRSTGDYRISFRTPCISSSFLFLDLELPCLPPAPELVAGMRLGQTPHPFLVLNNRHPSPSLSAHIVEAKGLDQASRPHDGAAVCDARHALPPFPLWLKAGGGFSAEKIPDDKQRG